MPCSPTPPADITALTRNVQAPRTPHTLEFAEEERGKTVYVAICSGKEKSVFFCAGLQKTRLFHYPENDGRLTLSRPTNK
jgi:hypothetical protein